MCIYYIEIHVGDLEITLKNFNFILTSVDITTLVVI